MAQRESDKRREEETVLVSRFSALGDVAMVIPVLYTVCRLYPHRRFVMLTRRHPAALFLNPPSNLTVKGIDTDDYKGPAGIWRLSGQLLKEFGPGNYVDLHDVLRTKLLRLFMRLRGVRKISRIRKGRRQKKALTRQHGKVLIQLPSTPSRYADTFRRAGLPADTGGATAFRSIFETKADPSLFSAVTAPKRQEEKWIAIAPFARHRGKTYPPELMKEVALHYASQSGYRVFIFGAGDKERAIIDSMCEGESRMVNMSRLKAGLAAELALLNHCDVMVSMDSANMHMASLAGIPAISIWGATHPYAGFLGWGQTEADAVQLDMVCRPCSVFGDRECRFGDYHCLQGINPRRIIERIDARLNTGIPADCNKS